jgi:hypothetical protein
MTRSTTRIAGFGAGALLALGFFTAAPAGASDGAKADATAQVETADAINQTLGLVNQACVDANRVGGAAVSALTSEHGIALAANQGGDALNLQVSLPALTQALPALDSLPLLGSAAGHVDAAQPLQISCAASVDGAGLGLSAAGVDALVEAIAPGVDVSGLDIDIPAVAASGSATTSGSAVPGTTAVSATAAGSLPATRASAAPSVRAGAAAPAASTTTSAAADATPATTSSSPSVSAGTLARTGAGVGALGLLGSFLIGGGRLLAFGRRFLRIG